MPSLRSTFLFLVLANLVLFAAGRGYFGRSEAGREPARLDAQITPERLVIVARGRGARPAAAPGAQLAVAASIATEAAAGPGETPDTACRAADGLTPEQALTLAEWVREDAERIRMTQSVAEDASSWWVYLPPARDKRASDARTAELRRLGIEDFYLVQDTGPNQRAVSLGVFKSQAKADEALAALARRGVKGARAGPREAAARVSQRFTGPEEALRALAERARGDPLAVTLAECATPR